jgi:hypothetical protein
MITVRLPVVARSEETEAADSEVRETVHGV